MSLSYLPASPALGRLESGSPGAIARPRRLPSWLRPSTALGRFESQDTVSHLKLSPRQVWSEGESLGVIDIGSRGFRLLVVDASRYASGFVERPIGPAVLCDASEALGLADCVAADGRLSEKGILQLITTTERVLEKHADVVPEPSKIFTSGTSLFRDCPNAADVAQMLFERTGLRLQVMSGIDEATIGLVGMLRSFAKTIPEGDPVITLDIGGGSTEICLARSLGDDILVGRRVSIPIGTKVVRSALAGTPGSSDHEVAQFLDRYVTRELSSERFPECVERPHVVVIGGAVSHIAGRQRYSHGKALEIDALRGRRAKSLNLEAPGPKYLTRLIDALERRPSSTTGRKVERHLAEQAASRILERTLENYGCRAALNAGLGLRHSMAYVKSLGLDPLALEG